MKRTLNKTVLAISSAALAIGLSACGERPEAVGSYSPEPGVQERAIGERELAGAERGILGERENELGTVGEQENEVGIVGDRPAIGEERPIAYAEGERERRY